MKSLNEVIQVKKPTRTLKKTTKKTEAYTGLLQISTMEHLATIVNNNSLAAFAARFLKCV